MSREQFKRHPQSRVDVALYALGGDAWHRRILSIAMASTLTSLLLVNSSAAAPLNILYFGNSFMNGGSANIPALVSDIAVAAGYDAPNYVDASVESFNFSFHLLASTGVISSGLGPGENWDAVVLQNYSTEPTHIGNVPQHRSTAVQLYQAVAAHSPSVVPVLFETWARGPGQEFYTGPTPDFPGGPFEMQAELHDAYYLAAGDIDVAAGSQIARVAEVGTAFSNTGFDPNLYESFMYHAEHPGILLAALVTYSAIYGDPTTDDIDLSAILTSLGLSPEQGEYLSGAATLASVPEPSSLALLATALAGLAFWRYRSRR